MLSEILRRGFALANRRAGFVFLDLVWKSIWVMVVMLSVLAVALWFTSGLRAIEWDDAGFTAANALIALANVREFWKVQRTEVFLLAVGMLALSLLVWFVLEAAFRRFLIGDSTAAARPSFHILLISNVAKSMALIAAGLVFTSLALAGATTIGVVSFVAFAFLLSLVDTLIRADAVDLFGTDLFRVAGLLGILMSFEAMVAASALALLVAGFANVAGATAAFVMVGAAVVAVVFLNILHSYLLLVRFSAIAIMRRNVVEI